jgi:hypothetical protein
MEFSLFKDCLSKAVELVKFYEVRFMELENENSNLKHENDELRSENKKLNNNLSKQDNDDTTNSETEYLVPKKAYDEMIMRSNRAYEKIMEYKIENGKLKNDLAALKKLTDEPTDQRLRRIVQNRINKEIPREYNTMPYDELLGCSAAEFKRWIEYQFTDGMTFDNVELDHVRPVATYDLTDLGEQKECFGWQNIRPVFPNDNKRKGIKRSKKLEAEQKQNALLYEQEQKAAHIEQKSHNVPTNQELDMNDDNIPSKCSYPIHQYYDDQRPCSYPMRQNYDDIRSCLI